MSTFSKFYAFCPVKCILVIRLLAKISLYVTTVIILSASILVLAVWSGMFGQLQTRKELVSFKNATATVVLSEDGKMIGKIFSENRTNVTYGQIPSHLISALIATEDARFFEHRGIDSRSLLRVLFKTLLLNSPASGGGSTISQQLAKNMYGRKKTGFFAVPVYKIKEAVLAHRLETTFTKEDILQLYLNTVPFGENVYGIEAASLRFFNKTTQALNIEESAVLIGMLKANDYYNPRLHPENARVRRNVVLNQMRKYKYLAPSVADSLCNLPLKQDYSNIELSGPADYFLYQVRNEAEEILSMISEQDPGKKWNIEEDGLIVNTTLNFRLQSFANASFREHLQVMQKKLEEQYSTNGGRYIMDELVRSEFRRLNLDRNSNEKKPRHVFDWDSRRSTQLTVSDSLRHEIMMLHAGLLAIDPSSGAVRAWVGGIDFRSHPYDHIYARRQLASTFKPVLFAAALEKGISPCHYFSNDSVKIEGFEDWSPSNFDNSFGGKYSLSGALVHSMNIPAFNVFLNVGFGRLDSLWRQMGFSFPLDDKPSLAMGTAEANIMETAIAYSAFANSGYRITPQKIISILDQNGNVIWQNDFSKPKERVLTERTSMIISKILQRAVAEGTGANVRSVYGVTLPLAGKTGTSQNYADAWFAAFNPGIVLVSRVGASMPSVHFNDGIYGSGSSLALPLVAITLRKAGSDIQLAETLSAPFPGLEEGMAEEMDCPDFKRDNILDDFIDIFKTGRLRYKTRDTLQVREKKSILKWIFGSGRNKRGNN